MRDRGESCGLQRPPVHSTASPVPCRTGLARLRQSLWCKHKDVQPRRDGVVPPDRASPFDNELGLVFTEVGPDVVKATLKIRPQLLQPMRIVHGGVYCSVVESVASVAAYTWLDAHGGGSVVGVNNNTDFLRSVGTGTVFSTATPLHRGRRQQLWLVTISDENGRTVARGQVRLQNLEPDPQPVTD